MKHEKTKTPDLKDIPPSPTKAWEYGYRCAEVDIQRAVNQNLVAVMLSIANAENDLRKFIRQLEAH